MNNDILVKVGADITDFSRKMSDATRTVSNFANSHKKTFASIGKAGDFLTKSITVPALAAATALTGITLVKGFNRLVGIDTARAKLSALGHDADTVESIMNNALDSVRGTSYGLDEAATIAASAVAAGIKPGKELTKYLSITGDAAAIAGADLSEMGSIFNKVQTAQRAYTGDLNMLADRGIPIYQWIGEAAGKSAEEIRDMASNGEVSSKMFFDAVDKNIGGAAKIIGEKSFAAAVKNIGSDIARIGANFLDAGGKGEGFFSTVKPLLTEFRGYLETLEGSASEFGVKFGEAFIKVVNTFRKLKSAYDGLHPSIQKIVKVVTLLGAVFLVALGPILRLIAFTPKLVEGFQTVSKVFRFMRVALTAARGALLGFSGPIGWITAAVILLATVIYKYWTPIKGFFVNLWGTVSNAFVNGFNAIDGTTHGWLRNAVDVYKSFYRTGIDIFKRYWQYVKETWSNALDFLKALIRLDFGGMKDAIGSQMSSIKSLLGDSWTIIKDNMARPLTALSNSVRNTFADLYGWLNDKTDGFFGHYIGLIVAWSITARDAFTSIWTYVKSTYSNALEFLKGLIALDFKRMNDAIRNHLEAGRTLITDIWASIKDNVIVKLREIAEALGEKLSGWKDLAVEKLSDMGAGIVNWFESMPGRILDKLSSWDTAITGWFETRPAAIEEQLIGWGRTIESWFIEQKDSFLELMQTWGETILGWFETVPNEIAPQLDEWGTTISEWFDNMPEVILTSLERWRKVMVEWTEEQDKENKEQFEIWKETIRVWFDTVPGLLKDKLSEWKDTISDKFEEMKELVSDRLDEWKEVIFAWYDEQPGNIRSSLSDWWKAFGKWMSEIPAKITTKLEEWWDAFKTWLKNLPNKPEVKNAGENMIDKVAEGNEAKREDFISKLGRLIIDVAKAALAMAAVAIFAVGRELIRDLISGIQSMSASLFAKMSDLGSGIVDKVMGFFNDMVTAGKSLIAGLVNGIKQMGAQAVNAITGVVDGVVSKAKSLLKIKSPSRVFMEIGKFTGEGLINGMDATRSAVERATSRMTEAATPDIDMSYDTPNGIHRTMTSAVNGTVDVNSRDGALIGAINDLRRDMTNLRIEMDGKQVGQVVEPHVTKEQNTRIYARNKRR